MGKLRHGNFISWSLLQKNFLISLFTRFFSFFFSNFLEEKKKKRKRDGGNKHTKTECLWEK